MEAANYLHTQPWKLAGVRTDENNPPICWMNWASEVLAVKSRLETARLQRLVGGGG